MPHLRSIYRYPIKGLTPEPLSRVVLSPGKAIPGDRLYAIENGPSGFDPAAPAYRAKTYFLMLMKNESLARLRMSFDQETHTLTINHSSPAGARKRDPGEGGESTITADLRSAQGREKIEAFFAEFCAGELRGPPKILHGGGHSFSDVAKKVVSIINLASVAAVESMVGAAVHPLRFRGNLYVDGWPAWSELDLVGRELEISPPPQSGRAGARATTNTLGEGQGEGTSVRLKVVKRIVRCAATNVDPDTGIRDLELPKTLLRHLGHADCGIYAEVIGTGEIAPGDAIEIL